jgi:hypothetical protein
VARSRLVAAIGRDQGGDSTYPEFMSEAWRAGVVIYVEPYIEQYAAVEPPVGERPRSDAGDAVGEGGDLGDEALAAEGPVGGVLVEHRGERGLEQ